MSHTDVRIGLNQTPQKDSKTEFEVVLLDGKDDNCGCATGAQNKIIVTVINDLQWQYVRFTEIDHLGFNYSDRCALFEVTRRFVLICMKYFLYEIFFLFMKNIISDGSKFLRAST